jgi:hypothetical protein
MTTMTTTKEQTMTRWTHTWSDRDGKRHTETTEGATGRDAKRALYAKIGVKRLIGVNTQPANDQDESE